MADPSSPHRSDADRPPLDAGALTAAVVRPGGLWRAVDVVERVGSTNAVLLARAAGEDAAEGLALVAEHQDAGRGRLDRVWVSPRRAGLTVSLLLRPDVPAARRGWLPLLCGVALAEAAAAADVRTALKWPNDLLAPGGAKLAGILAEVSGTAVVVGLGVNVSTRPDELPDGAASLAGERGAPVDRQELLLALLRAVERRYRVWTAALGDPVASGLARDYLAWCATVGAGVAATLPDGTVLEGTAEAVDWDGRLVVRTPAGTVELAAGDVRHVRARPAGG